MILVDVDIIKTDPKIFHGAACIAGTRIPVHAILEKIAEEQTFGMICDAYPDITVNQIKAALLFAAAVMEQYKPLGDGS